MSPSQIYSSPWHHPGLLLPLTIAALALVVVQRAKYPDAWSPFLRGWLLLWGIEIALDASLTGFASPLHGHPVAERVASIAFVILGDLRAYVLLERLMAPTRAWPSTWARALGWSLIASIAVALGTRVAPFTFATTRNVFLLYEVISLGLFGLWRFTIVPRREPALPSPRVALARDVSTFFAAQYALWASSDVLILAGVDVAYLLRIVPNVLYYGLFVAFVLWRSPRGLRP